ncbi:MAG: PemK family transcriptional regulator [Leptolyngbya sp.]|nr:MAG: PemK family transcriptional regulator [Leptolyngbya sp.]
MMMNPKRGEIWLVNLDPTIGSEIKKTRPVVIVNSDLIGKLPLKWVVPMTDWKTYFASNIWHVYIEPTEENGLSKPSAADVLQLRSVDARCFVRRLGVLPIADLQEVVLAIAAIIEYQEIVDG